MARGEYCALITLDKRTFSTQSNHHNHDGLEEKGVSVSVRMDLRKYQVPWETYLPCD